MKIYIIGAHSIGKSTLARFVSEKYKLPMLTEVARSVLSERELQVDVLRSNLDVVDSYQSEVFYRQITTEEKYDSFVSDRSLIDCLAYSAQHSRVAHTLVADKSFKHYIQSLKYNNVIIFFVQPTTATLKNDGVRENISWDGVVSISSQIKLLLELYDINHIQINTDSMQERIRLITSVMALTK